MAPTLVEHVVADAGAFLKKASLQVRDASESEESLDLPETPGQTAAARRAVLLGLWLKWRPQLCQSEPNGDALFTIKRLR